MNAGQGSAEGWSAVTVRRYGETIILEPQQPLARGGSVSVEPSFWSELIAMVDALRHRTAVKTRGEAAVEPALGASRLLQRQLDLARGLAGNPAGIILNGFFNRLNARAAEKFMGGRERP